MARSRIRLVSSKKSIPSVASYAFPSPLLVALLRWNWNTGRSNAAKVPTEQNNQNVFRKFVSHLFCRFCSFYLNLMAKEVVAQIKLQIPAGQANPAPPVGTALGPRGVNIMSFCKEFNAVTQKQAGDILPVVITVYKDKSFTFITKSPPAAVLLKKAANIAAGSKEPNKTKVGKVTRKQVMDIVKTKAKDLNARNDEAAFRIIAGTARQMGLEIVD